MYNHVHLVLLFLFIDRDQIKIFKTELYYSSKKTYALFLPASKTRTLLSFQNIFNLSRRRNVHLIYFRLVSLWKRNFWFITGPTYASTYQLWSGTHTSATDYATLKIFIDIKNDVVTSVNMGYDVKCRCIGWTSNTRILTSLPVICCRIRVYLPTHPF
jgi:hypothetical protein